MLHLMLKGLGVGLTALAITIGTALWPAGAVDPVYRAPEAPEAYGVAHEPLRPGTVLTYRASDGSTFVREVMQPLRLHWWDGTVREVIPVYDGRMDGYFFFQNIDGEIRVIGSLVGDRLERWGEYEVVLPATPAAVEQVETPAGTFTARPVSFGTDTAWFAEGVGLIRTDGYVLISIDTVKPRSVSLLSVRTPGAGTI